MNAPGKNFLKVPGILMIIFSALGIVITISGVACAACAVGSLGAIATAVGTLIIGLIVALLNGAVGLITGIFGVKYCDAPAKAQACLGLAIVFLALKLLSNIFNGFAILDVVDYALGIIYLLGAVKNRKAA